MGTRGGAGGGTAKLGCVSVSACSAGPTGGGCTLNAGGAAAAADVEGVICGGPTKPIGRDDADVGYAVAAGSTASAAKDADDEGAAATDGSATSSRRAGSIDGGWRTRTGGSTASATQVAAAAKEVC